MQVFAPHKLLLWQPGEHRAAILAREACCTVPKIAGTARAQLCMTLPTLKGRSEQKSMLAECVPFVGVSVTSSDRIIHEFLHNNYGSGQSQSLLTGAR